MLGKHTYCFQTKNGPVKATFQILGGHPADSGVPSHMRSEEENLEESIKQLLLGLKAIRDEQESMLLRQKAHQSSKQQCTSCI